jgi:isoquinoline 1-oxidoreductase beta subunit
VSAVIPIAEGVAVVGQTFDDAQRGVRALRVDWDDQHAERRSTEELLAEHRRLLKSGEKPWWPRKTATSTARAHPHGTAVLLDDSDQRGGQYTGTADRC